MSLTSSWLNSILKISSIIHREKEKLITSGILTTFITSIVIILLELVLLIISLPSYFFIGSKAVKQLPKNDAAVYQLRRKVSLAAFFGIILLIIFWIILLLALTLFAGSTRVHSSI